MANLPPLTLCEVMYDSPLDSDYLQDFLNTTKGVPFSARSHLSSRVNGLASGLAQSLPILKENGYSGVPSYSQTYNTYLEYLKNYYWEHPTNGQNGTACSVPPSLPARSFTSQTWHGALCDWDGLPPLSTATGVGMGMGMGLGLGRADRTTFLSLPYLPCRAIEELDWNDRRFCSKPKLKWVDSLNAWVPENKSTQRHPYINFINSPPRLERFQHVREGSQNSHRRGQDDASQKNRRMSYSTTTDLDSIRKPRTVRFETPCRSTACNSVCTSPNHNIQIPLSEQMDLSQADWEDGEVLEDESFELVQAQEDQQEEVQLVLAEHTPSPDDEVFEPIIVTDSSSWAEDLKESAKKSRLPGLLEVDFDEEDSRQDLRSGDSEDGKPVATSSPVPPPTSRSPTPPPAKEDTPRVLEQVYSQSVVLPSPSPSPSPRPVTPRCPSAVDLQEEEEPATEDEPTADLIGLMSRLSTLQRAKPKPTKTRKGCKTKPESGLPGLRSERPIAVVDRTPKAPRPRPVERPQPPPAAPKPPRQTSTGVTKPTTTKPIAKPPRPVRPKAEVKEKKTPLKPAPVVREKRIREKEKPPEEEEEPEDKPIPLPVSGPEDMIWTPEPLEDEPQPLSPPPVVVPTRQPVKKKEKLPPPPPRRRTPTPPPPPETVVETAIERDVEMVVAEEEKKMEEEDKVELPDLDPPTLPSTALPDLSGLLDTPQSQPGSRRNSVRSQLDVTLLAIKAKPRWGAKRRDRSLAEERERELRAEERRRRHAQRMDRHKNKKSGEESTNQGSRFVDYGFLAKYCILNPTTSEKYRYTFDQMDEGEKGYLTEEETAYGLRAINPNLSASERTYLFRVLEIAGHQMKHGTDFQLFSILAALSQRVSRLDEWARNMMAQLDYKNLERKLFLCRTLWDCNVDELSKTISLDQLIVELRAGGVSPEHEKEVRHKLADHRYFDFLDFLMYVPLFIMIHETVITDPLTVSRAV